MPYIKKIRAFDEILFEYPQQTTIHGIKYLANRSRPIAERIFWIITFIVSSSLLLYFVIKIGQTWMRKEVMLIDMNRPTNVFEIPFPAITICPQIKIKKNKLDFANLDDDMQPYTNSSSNFTSSNYGKKILMAMQICPEFSNFVLQTKGALQIASFIRLLPNGWNNVLLDISPSFDEVFDTCDLASWPEHDFIDFYQPENKCDQLFSTIITNEGICFTFNTIRDVLRVGSLHKDIDYHNITKETNGWDPEKGYNKAMAYPYKGIAKDSPLLKNGLKIVLKANMLDITPFCSRPNVGYNIVLHSPSEYPQTYDSFIELEFGKEYKIAVTPKTIETSEDLRSFSPEIRQCYFNDERKLQFFTFYNYQNCRLECYANYSKQLFEGVRFSSPRDANTTNFVMLRKNFGWGLPEFTQHILEHVKLYDIPKGWAELKENVNCKCLPECNAIHYDHKIIQSYDNLKIDEFDGSKNTTTIEIMFNEASFVGQKRVPRYTFETMLSDFGGLLGLFMGGSILSLFELFYFLAIRNCFKPKVIEINN